MWTWAGGDQAWLREKRESAVREPPDMSRSWNWNESCPEKLGSGTYTCAQASQGKERAGG